jgi:hypothetical protein
LSLVFWHNHLPLVLVDLKTNNPKGGWNWDHQRKQFKM